MAQMIYRLSPSLAPRPMQRDATSVAGRSADAAERQRRMDEEARQGPSNLLQRKMRIKRANAARAKPLSETTLESFADATSSLGDKFRFFPDQVDNVYSWVDETFNPLYFIGEMGSGLGQVPLAAKEGRIEDVVMGVGAPIAARFIGKVMAPAASASASSLDNFLTTGTPLKNAYKYNPFAFQPQSGYFWRGINQEGFNDAINTGQIRSQFAALEDPIGFGNSTNKFAERVYVSPHFPTAKKYADPFIVEIPGNAAKFNQTYDLPYWYKNEADFIAKHNYPPNWSMYTNDLLETNQVRILQPNWLFGLKENPVSKKLRKGNK